MMLFFMSGGGVGQGRKSLPVLLNPFPGLLQPENHCCQLGTAGVMDPDWPPPVLSVFCALVPGPHSDLSCFIFEDGL